MTTAAEMDHLFRHAYGKITSLLAARFTPRHIDLIEDAVQEALLRAMQSWSYGSTPANPQAWIYRVASNLLIDHLRRESRLVDFENLPPQSEQVALPESELPDEQLRMIFACCHPAMKMEEQLMLSLKLLCGLSTREIARALLRNPEAVKKAIGRAREKFREKVGKLEIPAGKGLQPRLEAVLRVLYLMFNEGYSAAEGSDLIRRDLCEEAIRLGMMLDKHAQLSSPKLKALLALMHFHLARFDARTDAEGRLVTLKEQNRERWNQGMIQEGRAYLLASFAGEQATEYHLLALIAGHYTTAPDYGSTDWQGVLSVYDQLLRLTPSPIVAMNRVVVLKEVEGAEVALEELNMLGDEPLLQKHHLYFAIRAELEEELGQLGAALTSLRRGLECSKNEVERMFLQAKIEKIEAEMTAANSPN